MRPIKETPEEKAARLEKHKRFTAFILQKEFLHNFSEVFKSDYWDCKRCKKTIPTEKEALDHYFSEHHVKKG